MFCRERGLRQRTVLPTGIFCRAQLSVKRPSSPRAIACREAGPRRSCHLPTADVCREPLSANVFFAESPRFCSRQKSRISAKDVFPVVVHGYPLFLHSLFFAIITWSPTYSHKKVTLSYALILRLSQPDLTHPNVVSTLETSIRSCLWSSLSS